ncbi:MAG TPA: translocation/assembly module TamB domain-containing protein [Blastocatellia bacterium]|nr:translocation/assembly module TamB domain-containing protein [Blastocatellia bacterium]
MRRTPEPPEPNPTWAARHKKLLISGGVILLLILGLVLGGVYYIRSGRLNRYISGQVQTALADYGMRAEIGELDISWSARRAKANNVKLYNQETGQLIATLDSVGILLDIPAPFALRLRREVIFKRVDLDNLQAYVELDAQGRSNFSGLHAAPPNAPGRITFDFSGLVGTLTSGTLHINDQLHQIVGEVTNLQGTAQPLPDGSAINLQFNTGASPLRYEGRDTGLDVLDLAARVGNDGVTIDRFNLRSPLGEINTSGRLEDWSALRYNANVKASVALTEAARVFAPDLGLQGSATFNGDVSGEGAKYKITGGLTSDDIAATGDRIRGAGFDDINVESDGERIAFSSSQARSAAAKVQGNQLAGVAAYGISGEIKDGVTRAAVQKLTVARVGTSQVQVSDVAANGISAEVIGGRTQATVGQITVARVALRDGQVNGIALRGATANIEGGRYQIKGNLDVRSGVIRGSQVGPVRGQLVADNNAVALNRFNATLMGGTATGDAVVSTASRGTSRLTASLTDLKTGELFRLLQVNDAPLAGSVNSQVRINWPGTKFDALSGNVTAHLSGETTQTEGTIPLTGDVAVTAQRGLFNIDQFVLATNATQLTASGQVAMTGDSSDLRFSLTSTRAEELQTIAYSINSVKEAVAEYQPRLSGDFRFDGRVTGSLSDPAIEGDLNAANIGAHEQSVGSLTGHLRFSPQVVAFENGVLATTDGGTARFTYSVPRAEVATSGRLDATIDRINIETITAAAGLSSLQNVISGALTGEAHLTGLPGSPTGTATINLVNGTVEGQTADAANASLVFDGRTARLERAELRVAQGQLTASGQYDLKSSDFQLQGRADNVDLNQLATSLNVTTANVTGVANATFQASGNAKDLGELKVEATAQGEDVTINGRSAGELSLTARTDPGGRVDVDLVTGITGKPQPLHASIELRRPGRPITVESTLTNFDLAPLVAAFAPGAASSITGMVNGRLYVIGPIENSRGEMTLDGLRGDLTLNTISLTARGRAINIQTPVIVTLNGPQVALNQTRIHGQGFDLRVGGTLGLSGSAPLDFALNGTANLDSLGQLSPDLFLAGAVTVDARLTGTTSDPRLAGEIRMDKLSASGTDLPVAIEDGNGRIVLAGDRITIESFTARANEGTLTAGGSMTLDQLRPKDWHFTLAANRVDVIYEGAHVIANANLDLTGTSDRQVLSGTINIPEGEYTTNLDVNGLTGGDSGGGTGLSFGGGGGGSASGAGPLGLPPVGLDLHINAPGTVLIRNQQVNTVGSIALTVAGTVNDPNITGRVSVEGGTIKLRGQRYDIMTGTLDFAGGGADPTVNLLTEADISDYHVYVGLIGPLDQIEVTLRSDPDLPRSDILSLVATGHIDSNTLASQDLLSSGLGAAASLLSQQFISQPTESLLGLNRFQIDPVLKPNENPAARLTIGKQLTRDLTFTYSTNVGSEQDQSAIVEYTLTNRFSGIASYTQGGTITNGARTNSDFTIEVRGRRRFALGFEQPLAGATPDPVVNAPPRPARQPLPPADVTLDNPAGVKLSSKKLRELLPVETQGFSRPLARLGERNLENYLQEQGYFFATVRSRCEPADCSGPNIHLYYDVQPGQRYDLDDIRIEGTDQLGMRDVGGDLQSKKASLFGAIPLVKSLPLVGGYARGITSNDRIRRDREIIRARMADLGFRSARVTSRTDTKPQSPDLILVFQVDEGPRATVADVTFRGNAILSSADLRKAIAISNDDAFSPTKARQATQNIKGRYAEQGFLDTTAPYSIVDLAPDRVMLEYDITEGPRAIVAEIDVSGQTKTREASIRRFFAFEPGDVLTPAAIRRTQRDLYATGAFSEVSIRHEQMAGGNPDARKVTVQVTESKPLLMVYGIGFSTDEGPRGLLQLTNTNLFGRANSISLRMRGSFREELVQLQYTDLRVFSSDWAATISAFYDRNSNLRTFTQRRLVGGGTAPNNGPGFGIDRFVAFLQAERKFTDTTSLRLRYSFENSKLFNIENIPLEEIARNETAIRLGLFSAGLTRDTRNSALNPTKGQLISFEHSVAARPFGGNEAFNKFFTNYQRYYQLSPTTPGLRDTVLAFASRIGLAAPFNIRGSGPGGTITEVDRQLPISQRFFAGGATTLRGFRFEQAGPQGILEPRNAEELPTLVPLGGDAMVVLNFELRYPLTKQLRLVPFYDFGNVFRKVSDIDLSGMTHTIGLGLRLNTPIGPVGIDYGYLLNPPSFTSATGIILRQPQGVIHIRFGQTF